MGIHLLCCAHGNECTKTHDAVCNIFVAIVWNDGFHVGQKQLHVLPLATLISLSSCHCVHQRWNSHFSSHCHNWTNTCRFTSLILHNSRICYLQCSSIQIKKLLQLTPHNQFLPLAIEVFGCLPQTCWCVFIRLCQCHLELQKARRHSSFFWLFVFVKKNQLHCKGCKHPPS
jgi:hypothetical protein